MKILQINKLYYPWIGGVEHHVQQLSEALSKLTPTQVSVLCCNTCNKTEKKPIHSVPVTKVQSFGLFSGSPLSILFPFYLLNQIRDAHILHFHLPNPLAVLSYLLLSLTKRHHIVVTWHSDIIRQKKFMIFYRFFLTAFLRRCDVIITTNPNMVRSSPHLSQFQNKIKVVPLSIDPQRYVLTPDEVQIRDRISTQYEKHLLFVGRFVYYKGIYELIQAIQNTACKLILIGQGPLEKEIHKMTQLCKPNQITILPPQPFRNLKAHFAACEFLVLPSTHNSEAFGIVQLEAMIYSKPVISTRLPTGVPFVNQHMETGLTVEPGDTQSLQSAIETLWNDKQMVRQLGVNAKNRVEKEFSLKKMLVKINDIYNNLDQV